MRVYFDNAATTQLDKRVLDAMMPYMLENFGNPSSIHTHGREAKTAVERARKKVAAILNTSPSEIFFTSGGTEADNTAIFSPVRSLGLKYVITSKIEHHAVLHVIECLEKKGEVQVDYVDLDEVGSVDLVSLEKLVKKYPKGLVSLMHGNNEIGNLTNLNEVTRICKENNWLFHSDTTQTIGHYPFDLTQEHPDFLVASAHKFHGPKGVGLLFKDASLNIDPLVLGGAQERNMRGGTENISGIVGLAEALEIATNQMAADKEYVLNLKKRAIDSLKQEIPGIEFNGLSDNLCNSLYTVLNVRLPIEGMGDMLLFNLDIHQISVSAGSACSSGTNIGSHVLQQIISEDQINSSIRISFSRNNTTEEVDYVIEKLKEICIEK